MRMYWILKENRLIMYVTNMTDIFKILIIHGL